MKWYNVRLTVVIIQNNITTTGFWIFWTNGQVKQEAHKYVFF